MQNLRELEKIIQRRLKKEIKMNCAIVGSTKISKIHARELVRNKIKNITFISRKKLKSKSFASKLNKEYYQNFESSNHNIFKIKKFDLISICSNSKYHFKNLLNIPSQKTKILIEKPIISLKRNENFRALLNKIYLKHKNIFVSYPMYYLAKSFKQKNKNKNLNIKKINFYYQTSGKHLYREIFIDLAPHAFSFIFSLLGVKNNFTFSLNKIVLKKKQFKCDGTIGEVKFKINLIQDTLKKKSIFKFSINNQKFQRVTTTKKKIFTNYLKIKKKLISIENPMTKVIKEFLKKKYKNNYGINKKLTYCITEISQEIYDKSF